MAGVPQAREALAKSADSIVAERATGKAVSIPMPKW
jgi:hypothetical protein